MILTTMMQKNNSNTWNKIFQALEQSIPSIGTKYSRYWNKDSQILLT